MAGTTLTGVYANPVYLTISSFTNPVLLDSSALFNATYTAGLFSGPGTAWTIVNKGQVETGGIQANDGIYLRGGGIVTNASGGVIGGASLSILIQGGAGAVTNQSGGVILNQVRISQAGAVLYNAGAIDSWVDLPNGGSVTNANGGTISGGTVSEGLQVYGAGAVVVNDGLIVETAVGIGIGVNLAKGGTVTNSGTIVAASTGIDMGFAPGAGIGTVSNNGVIQGTSSYGVLLVLGGEVTNAIGATISGAFEGVLLKGTISTLDNGGRIFATTTGPFGIGADLQAGGSVTNEQDGTITGYAGGVYFSSQPGTLTNLGSVGASHGAAVGLVAGGAVSNALVGVITGGSAGVYAFGGPASIGNSGTISASSGVGVLLDDGGTVSNYAATTITGPPRYVFAGATITGSRIGVEIGQSGTVINGGLIATTNNSPASYGVELGSSAGAITNQAGGTITAYGRAIETNGPATIVNYGTIKATGTSGIAIMFGGGANNLLVDEPGAVFIGSVLGSGYFPGPNVLQLASGASQGLISGIGAQYVGFTAVNVDAGASWQMTGANTIVSSETLTNSGTLKLLGANLVDNGGLVNNGIINVDPSTLIAGDVIGTGIIDIGADSTVTIGGTVSAGETIAFTGTAAVLNILHSALFAGTISSAGPSDIVNLSCFASGTQILTLRGAVPVEEIRIGDRLPVRFEAAPQPVTWLGRRHVDCRRHSNPRLVWPVRIAAHAFGPGQPERDLLLSPDHAVFINDVLIPVRLLMNGGSIAQVPVDEVTYHHIELPQHDVLLAEGLSVESYLEVGDRSGFSNGGGPIALHPDFASRQWEAFGCAPLVVVGAELDAVRRMLDRAVPAAA